MGGRVRSGAHGLQCRVGDLAGEGVLGQGSVQGDVRGVVYTVLVKTDKVAAIVKIVSLKKG